MPLGEIDDMDIIADARAIGSCVVIAVDIELIAPADGNL